MSVHTLSFFIPDITNLVKMYGVPKFYPAFILMGHTGLGTATGIAGAEDVCWPTALTETLGLLHAHWKHLKARRGATSSKLSPEFENGI